MLTCIEEGHWPDVLPDVMSDVEVDALVDHAAVCRYHSELLDRDEEEFLEALRLAEGLYSNSHAFLRRGGGHPPNAPKIVSRPRQESDEECYNAYQRWVDERCPIEILQVRRGGSNVCTFDLTRDGGSWRLNIKPGDEPLQFWTLCPRHQDEVMLAAYPIYHHASERAEASTLSFANGQSLSVLVEAKDENDFDVWLHCTSPRPAGVRCAVYNLGSLSDHCSIEPAGTKNFKTSQLLEDFVKLADLRVPVRNLEAARLFDDLPKEKYVGELLSPSYDQFCQEAEPLGFACPSVADQTSREAQEDEPKSSESVVALVKKWVGFSGGTGHLYGSYRRVTKVKPQGFHIEISRAAMCAVGRERLTRSFRHTSQNCGYLFISAGVASVIGTRLSFVPLDRDVDLETDIMSIIGRENAMPVSNVYQCIKEYYSRYAGIESEHRLFVPPVVGRREQLLPQCEWPIAFRDMVDTYGWAIFEADRLTLFEKFFAGFVEAQAPRISSLPSWKKSVQAFRERIRMTGSLDRVCKSCSPQELGYAERNESSKENLVMIGDTRGEVWVWPSSDNIPATIPVTASLWVAGSRATEFYGEVL